MGYFFDKWKFLKEKELRKRLLLPSGFDYLGYFTLEDFSGNTLYLWGAVKYIEMPEKAETLGIVRDAEGKEISRIYRAGGKLILPFDIEVLLEGLLLERYVKRSTFLTAVAHLYYMAKPLMPLALQTLLRIFFYRLKPVRNSFPSWPFEDRLHKFELYILKLLMETANIEQVPFLWFWPGDYEFALLLTHDVESSSGVKNVRKIMDIERQYGFKSSFNFVTNKYDVPAELIEYIKKEGFEVGVHGYKHDGKLFCNYTIFKARTEKIMEKARQWGAVGFRSPSTLRNSDWLQKMPFLYDSSFFDTDPYEPQPGGTLSVFPFMLGNLVELPITLPQDHILFKYLGEKNPRVWLEKIKKVKSLHGLALLNAHPDNDYLGNPHYLRIYENFLSVLKDIGGYWNPLPKELAQWWKKRMKLDVDNMDTKRLSSKIRVAILKSENGCLAEELVSSPLNSDT